MVIVERLLIPLLGGTKPPSAFLSVGFYPRDGVVKNMVGDHEDRLREMDCDMVQLRLELVELQSLREGFKHFVADHWLPLIQYLHSFPNTQCSCGTDARDGTDSASSYHTPPQCSSPRPIPPPQTRPPSPSPSIPTLDSQSESNSDSDDNCQECYKIPLFSPNFSYPL